MTPFTQARVAGFAAALSVLMLGSAGGRIKGGRVLDYKEKPERQACRLYLSMMEKMNVRLAKFGDATKQFDARDFPVSSALDQDNNAAKVETVEGVQTYIVYDKPGETTHASGLQIQRNYQNAVKAAGGVVVAEFGAEGSDKALNDSIQGELVVSVKLKNPSYLRAMI